MTATEYIGEKTASILVKMAPALKRDAKKYLGHQGPEICRRALEKAIEEVRGANQ